MNKSDSTAKISKALASVQGRLGNAKKVAQNPHLKNKYADLTEVLDTLREVAAEAGVSYVQTPAFGAKDGAALAGVETLVMFEDEWIAGSLLLPVTKQDAQGVGSAITYARRYSLAAIFGIGQEDDDASAAVTKKATPKASASVQTEFRGRIGQADRPGLKALKAEILKLPDADQEALLPAYNERKAWLDAQPAPETQG